MGRAPLMDVHNASTQSVIQPAGIGGLAVDGMCNTNGCDRD